MMRHTSLFAVLLCVGATGANALAVQDSNLYVLDTSEPVARLVTYAPNDNGDLKALRTQPLDGFPSTTGKQADARMELAALSADRASVAFVLNRRKPPYRAYIAIWNMRSGKRTADIEARHEGGYIHWCAWDAAGHLWYNEDWLGADGKRAYVDLNDYDPSRRAAQVVSTLSGDYAAPWSPPGYWRGTRGAIEAFERLGASPPPAMEQGGEHSFDIGVYTGTGAGAVSGDGGTAVALVRDESRRFHFMVERNGTKLGDLFFPYTADVRRCDISGPWLTIAVRQKGQDVVRVWSLPSLKSAATVPGSLVVDTDLADLGP